MLYIELDHRITRMQPQSINWEPPAGMGTDGQGGPIYAPRWSCNLGFSYLTLIEYNCWHDAVDRLTHTIRLPHPITGVMTDFTAFVSHVTPRLRPDVQGVCRAATTGADIGLTRIQVT